MKKPEIARRWAREAGISRAAAADELDRVVHRILTNLRKNSEATVPGLGVFSTTPEGIIRFVPEQEDSSGER